MPLQLMNNIFMKTKRQIEHFLRNKKFASEMDFKLISSYCMTEHKIRLHVPTTFTSNPDSISCPSFTHWLEHGFGGGDIVVWGDCIGLVCDSFTKEIEICLSISPEGVEFNNTRLSCDILSYANHEQKSLIYKALREAHQEFNDYYFTITEKFIPREGDLVHFKKYDSNFEGYGVTRLVDKNTGDVVMYCYLTKDNAVHYDMYEHIGIADDFQFSTFKASDYPRKLLDIALSKVGKTWNHFLKRIEPLNMKVDKGEKYWYITDKMSVAVDIEKGTATSHKRYLVANYFRNEADAYRILSEEVELRRNYLAEPQKES